MHVRVGSLGAPKPMLRPPSPLRWLLRLSGRVRKPRTGWRFGWFLDTVDYGFPSNNHFFRGAGNSVFPFPDSKAKSYMMLVMGPRSSCDAVTQWRTWRLHVTHGRLGTPHFETPVYRRCRHTLVYCLYPTTRFQVGAFLAVAHPLFQSEAVGPRSEPFRAPSPSSQADELNQQLVDPSSWLLTKVRRKVPRRSVFRKGGRCLLWWVEWFMNFLRVVGVC